jgi:hypothetical protein
VQIDELEALRRHHPAWRLLRAAHAPLVLSFLGKVFVEENVRSIPAPELISRLDDELYRLNAQLGDDGYSKPAKAYLDDWASPDSGWLLKYYPSGSDEPHFDATPDVEKALGWLRSLEARPFVGTESRLNTIFDLLRQMVFGSETDPDIRIEELQRRRREIDAEIARVRAGDVDVLESAGLRDRYQRLSATAGELLADFRQVESNFRSLDRELRARIAAWDGSKGELLDGVLGERASVADSDQGKSFHAFYDFLLSQHRQKEFVQLLDQVHALVGIGDPDPRMRHIHHQWLEAGERTQSTFRLLSEQLRRFLDEQVWLENRRVIEILRAIESTALRLRDAGPVALTLEMEGTAPTIVLPMERPLYSPAAAVLLDGSQVWAGEGDLDTSLLFEQVHVDRARLSLQVRQELADRDQIGFTDLVARRPIEQGLGEVVGYLSLDDPWFDVVFDETVRQLVGWHDADGARTALVPAVTFVRTGRTGG